MIVAVMMACGGLAGCFLPETLHQKLPDTLADAHIFGAEQKYFSLPKRETEQKFAYQTT